MSAPLAADVQTSPAQVHGAKVQQKMQMRKYKEHYFQNDRFIYLILGLALT